MKNRKKLFCALGAVLLFAVAAIVLVKLYPTLQLYYMAERTGQDVITTTDESGNESLGLGIKKQPEPTISPDVLKGEIKGTSYSFEQYTGGTLEYTMNDVHFYDSVDDSGIDPGELMQSQSVVQLLDSYMFFVADFTVTSHGAVPNYELNDGSKGFLMDLNPCAMLEYEGQETISGTSGEMLCYFSAHPPISDTSTDYYGFTLEDGQSLNFQIGCLVPPQEVESQSVCLVLGPTDLGYIYPLFDFSQEKTP